jgi:hypothetical protein
VKAIFVARGMGKFLLPKSRRVKHCFEALPEPPRSDTGNLQKPV